MPCVGTFRPVCVAEAHARKSSASGAHIRGRGLGSTAQLCPSSDCPNFWLAGHGMSMEICGMMCAWQAAE